MKTHRTLILLAVGAALSWTAAAGAQQQPQIKGTTKPPAVQPAVRKPAAELYDRYEASQRQRLRRDTCMRDEDMAAQYCVKKCQAGYVVTSGSDLPRVCRSEKPFPAGALPQAYRRQPAIQPVPPPPSKQVPGA